MSSTSAWNISNVPASSFQFTPALFVVNETPVSLKETFDGFVPSAYLNVYLFDGDVEDLNAK